MSRISGECKKCGYCCRHVQFSIPFSSMAMEWAQARGIQVTQVNDQFMEMRLPQVCKNLKEDGTCGLQDSKPTTCVAYPFSMINFWENRGFDPVECLGPQCGFKYEKEAEYG